jgi:hypothetical protein
VPERLLRRIVVRLRVGEDKLAASDDPLFLGLRGAEGREFRLLLARGRSLRRGADDVFVLSQPDDPDTNVDRPELNDPASPPLHAGAVTGVYLRKGLDPIPNVRGRGEMDDRLQVFEAEVELHEEGAPKPRRFVRRSPIWLGLVCGLVADLAPEPDPS